MFKLGQSALSPFKNIVGVCRSQSSTVVGQKSIVVAPNSGNILCWHPAKSFPYAHSIAIDTSSGKDEGATTILSDLSKTYPKKGNTVKGPTNKELQEIFGSNKHEWYTRTREDKLYQTSAPIPKRK